MNENPGETPNPLNPGQNPVENDGILNANPPEPTQPIEVPTQPVEIPVNTPEVTQPTNQAADSASLVTPAQPASPMDRPMQAAPEAVEAKPKKKTGLIIGMIVSIFLAVGCGVAAILLLTNNKKVDAVSAAMNKVMRGEVSSNVVIDGNIEIPVNIESYPISNIKINLNSQLRANSMINASKATVSLETEDGDELSFKFNEVYSSNGDLYFKIDGLTNAVEDLMTTISSSTNTLTDCNTNELGETNCETTTQTVTEYDGATDLTNGILNIISTIDGEWLRISPEELGTMTGGTLSNSTMSCIVDLTKNINTNSNSVAELYAKNPFVSSTTEGVTIMSKGNPVYRVAVDGEGFTNYVNSLQSSEILDDLYTCLGVEDNAGVNANDLIKMISQLPETYVEIDEDYNFTRLYLESQKEPMFKIDLSFTYPNNINVAEPTEYTDYSSIIQEIFSGIYDTDYGLDIDVEVESTED